MGCCIARNKATLQVVLLLRDPILCKDINEKHMNTRYLNGFALPQNVTATTDIEEAIAGAQYAIHAVPVQATRKFLASIRSVLPIDVPIFSVSKGIEVDTGFLMSELIPSALARKHPTVFLSGPSFAKEVWPSFP